MTMNSMEIIQLRRSGLLKKAQHQREKALVYATLAIAAIHEEVDAGAVNACACMARADEIMNAIEECEEFICNG